MSEQAAHFLKPNTVERLFGKLLEFLVRVGVVRAHFYVLEVKGRKSGRTISLPTDPIEVAARRYLVCARGESQWVRNVRAAADVALVRAFRRDHFSVKEVPVDERPRILKAYLDTYSAEVQRFFSVPKGSPAADFAGVAAGHPVFELVPRPE